MRAWYLRCVRGVSSVTVVEMCYPGIGLFTDCQCECDRCLVFTIPVKLCCVDDLPVYVSYPVSTCGLTLCTLISLLLLRTS